MSPQTQDKRIHPEDKYQAELKATEVSPAAAKAITWAFVAMLFAVPVSQGAVELWRHQAPRALAIFAPVRTATEKIIAGDWPGALGVAKAIVSRQFPKSYEEDVERASIAKSFFQPRLQAVVTGVFRFGNDKGVLGRNAWLFYQPGLDYLTGPDIIDPEFVRLSIKKMVDKKGEQNPIPDPRPAILKFQQDCAARGIRLVVVPIPDKSMLQPAQLTARMEFSEALPPPNNRGYGRFIQDLQKGGVDVFDPAPAAVRPGEIRYLTQDTHWTPQFMDSVAQRLALHIDTVIPLPAPAKATSFRLSDMSVSRVGDLVDMLKLPRSQQIYAPESVIIRQVIDDRTGWPWEPDRNADVLLLGDSFTNVFSQPAMGWGKSAGFAEHISYHLHRPLDVIALNGAAAAGTRLELSRATNAERLARKNIIIYEFAVRFLMGENWKVTSLPEQVGPGLHRVPALPATAPTTSVPAATPKGAVRAAAPAGEKPKPSVQPAVQQAVAEPLVVVAQVTKISNVPKPGTAPYKDCLTYIKLRVEKIESGTYAASELIAVFWAMKDNEWLPAASYAAGDRLHLKLTPLKSMDRATQAMQRADDLDDFTLEPYFTLSADKL